MKPALLLSLLLITIGSLAQVEFSASMLDSSFGRHGRKIIPNATLPDSIRSSMLLNALTLQSNNKIIAGGYTITGIGTLEDSFKIIRLNTDGNIDRAFGNNGVTSFIYPGVRAHRVTDIHCQADDKIVGSVIFWGNDYIYGLFRLNKNGTIDSGFGINGFKKTDDYTSAMTVLPNDNIITANYREGNNTWYYDLHFFNKDGILIKTNSVRLTGYRKPYVSDQIALRLTTDHKIILAGNLDDAGTGISIVSVIRFLASGAVDSSFNGNGFKILVDYEEGEYNDLGGLALQSNNEIMVAFSGNSHIFRVTRIHKNGDTDSSFGDNGLATAVFGRSYAFITDLQVQKDDKIVAFGYTFFNYFGNSKLALARFNVAGTLDSTFGEKGKTVTDFSYNGAITTSEGAAMIIQADGKIVGSGTIDITGMNYFDRYNAVVVRYLGEKEILFQFTKQSNAAGISNSRQSISISPDPVYDRLNIFSGSKIMKHLSVLNQAGSIQTAYSFSGNRYSLNVSNLAAGIYYLQIINTDNTGETVKFIKK